MLLGSESERRAQKKKRDTVRFLLLCFKNQKANLSFTTDLQCACVCVCVGVCVGGGCGWMIERGADTQNGNHISHCMYNESLRVKWPISTAVTF